MTLWLALTVASPTTWQEAYAIERRDAEIPAEEAKKHAANGNLVWFVRLNQSLEFDAAAELSVAKGDPTELLIACRAAQPHDDIIYWDARNHVEANLGCKDTPGCTLLGQAIRGMREACLNLVEKRWDVGARMNGAR